MGITEGLERQPPSKTILTHVRIKLRAELQESPYVTDGAGSQAGNTQLASRP